MISKSEYEKRVWESDLQPTEKLVALAFAAHADWKTGEGITLSVLGAADKAGLHRNTVRTVVKTLTDKGWLLPEGKAKGNVTKFSLGAPEVVAQSECNNEVDSEDDLAPRLHNESTQVAQSAIQVAQLEGQVAQPVATNVTRTLKNKNLTTTNLTKNKNSAASPAPGLPKSQSPSLFVITSTDSPLLSLTEDGVVPTPLALVEDVEWIQDRERDAQKVEVEEVDELDELMNKYEKQAKEYQTYNAEQWKQYRVIARQEYENGTYAQRAAGIAFGEVAV